MTTSNGAVASVSAAERIAGIRWYHTIPLGNGLVTKGIFDHSGCLPAYPIPARMDGMRVLDVGTFDGYWAFEFERRGAAEVVALDVGRRRDLDLSPRVRASLSEQELNSEFGLGFRTAKEILGSKVRREVMSIYDLSPETIGTFDLVHSGAILLHLQNPVKALAAVKSVVKGHAVLVDAYSPRLPFTTMRYLGARDLMAWWAFSVGALRQMMEDAGFDNVELVNKFALRPSERSRKVYYASFRAR